MRQPYTATIKRVLLQGAYIKLILAAALLIVQDGTLMAQVKQAKKPKAAVRTKKQLTTGEGATALFIKENGDVGIGTPDPGVKLDVRGATAITGNTTVNGDMTVNGNGLTLNTGNPDVQFRFTGNAINLNSNPLFFKGPSDRNAFIKWGLTDKFGRDTTNDDDKMVIAGYRGVKIGYMGNPYKKFFPVLRVGDENQVAKVDIMAEARRNDHQRGKLALYVTGNMKDFGTGVEFRNSEATEGIGFTQNIIYATNNNQNMHFKTFGQGNMTFSVPEQRMFIRSNGTVGIMRELFVGDEGIPTLKSANNGFVGIGIADPKVPLHVNKTNGFTTTNYEKDASEGRTFRMRAYDKGNAYAGAAGSWADCSIYAIGDIVTRTGFVGLYNTTFSDIRLKKDLRPSSAAQDLNTLRQLQVTDYKMIDTIQNNRTYKKVIAQQVQKVYPTAIGTGFRTLPDVFQQAVTVTKQTDSLYTITLAKPAKINTGDQLELKCTLAGDANVSVIKVLDGKSFTVHAAIDLAKQPGVFVYGHPSADVLTVDYEAISMLNVSATQQLANTIDAQQKQIDKLTKQNAELMQAVQAMTLAMERLQKTTESKTQATAQVQAASGK